MNVYVVIGSTGEMGARIQWVVAAYMDQAAAWSRARLAGEAAERILVESEASDCPPDARDAAINSFDGGMQMDYTGTVYSVREIPLLDAIPNAATLSREGR